MVDKLKEHKLKAAESLDFVIFVLINICSPDSRCLIRKGKKKIHTIINNFFLIISGSHGGLAFSLKTARSKIDIGTLNSLPPPQSVVNDCKKNGIDYKASPRKLLVFNY